MTMSSGAHQLGENIQNRPYKLTRVAVAKRASSYGRTGSRSSMPTYRLGQQHLQKSPVVLVIAGQSASAHTLRTYLLPKRLT